MYERIVRLSDINADQARRGSYLRGCPYTPRWRKPQAVLGLGARGNRGFGAPLPEIFLKLRCTKAHSDAYKRYISIFDAYKN